jgi:serine/threonine protein kinase/lipopolysaccharide biosynthesis regulator YciM
MTVEDVFLAALEKSPPERPGFLDSACGGDAELRSQVEALLRSHVEAGSLLEQPIFQPGPTVDGGSSTERSGAVIGPYKLIEPIGEGGMGTVWMAQQTEPIKRLVALKLIKSGMDTKLVIARFEAERQALALMDHPNIAKVFDAGTTGGLPIEDCRLKIENPDANASSSNLQSSIFNLQSSGRPYFVMELVKGVPITKYCDEHHLTPRQRLELFVPVCHAIQHAHQKGIIHRDLKPSNVLVALYDGKPVPKVIDFGVAKAAGQSLTDKTLVTGFGAIVGTLEYMSPEQAEINQLDIDTRSDIYSLGVLLYELLTGSTPFSKKDLEAAGMLEMLRVIREVEPSKPSTKLSQLSSHHAPGDEPGLGTRNVPATLASIAANRGTEPAKLTKLVRGELDWVVMKALEKERNRRYETANGFAEDVQRYLADEPVIACPPSAAYRLRKFVRRNRRPVWAAAAIALSLVAGIIGTTGGLIWADQARQAESRRANAEKHANELAQKRLQQIEAGSEILDRVFADLDPLSEEREDKPLRVILGERLMMAAKQLEGNSIGDALVVAKLQNRLGVSLQNLGMAERAIPLLVSARETRTSELGRDHPDTLRTITNLATSYRHAGQFDQAISLRTEVLKSQQATLGADHPDTLSTMNSLALDCQEAGKLDQAVSLYEETLRRRSTSLGADNPETLRSMNNLAYGYQSIGKVHQALELYEDTLKLRKAILGADHHDTVRTMNNIATAYQSIGKLDQALLIYEECLRLRKTKLGADHPYTLKSMGNLAYGLRGAGRLDQALELYEETNKLMRAKWGNNHPDTLTSMNNLAMGYQAAGRLDQAIAMFQETLGLLRRKLGSDHPNTITIMDNLASAYQRKGEFDKALPLAEEAADGVAKRCYRHEYAEQIVNNLIDLYQHSMQFDRAEKWRMKLTEMKKSRDP